MIQSSFPSVIYLLVYFSIVIILISTAASFSSGPFLLFLISHHVRVGCTLHFTVCENFHLYPKIQSSSMTNLWTASPTNWTSGDDEFKEKQERSKSDNSLSNTLSYHFYTFFFFIPALNVKHFLLINKILVFSVETVHVFRQSTINLQHD